MYLEALADYTASKHGKRPGFSSKLVHRFMGQNTKLGGYDAPLWTSRVIRNLFRRPLFALLFMSVVQTMLLV